MPDEPIHESDDVTRSSFAPAPGAIVGHYRIIEKIGAGGMGEVYLAEDSRLDRRVALKFLPPAPSRDAECRARFTREAQAAARLDHPNIVAVHEVGEYQGRPFFSMQYVEGSSLKELIAGAVVPLDRVIAIGIQLCEALQAAHEAGITHRDIKPANVLLDSHGRARIVDFGLASVLGGQQLTGIGTTLGTVGYMSPEQVRGEPVDHRSDLFSLGIVLYELTTGQAPFRAGTEAATLHSIMSAHPEPLARYRRNVPPSMQSLIDKALAKDVATRYQHADEIAADLRRILAQGPSQMTSAPSQRPRVVLGAGAALALFAVVIGGYRLLHRPSAESTVAPDGGRKTIAVLPFLNLSGDPGLEYLSDGITEELTTKLSRLSALRVTSRSTAMSVKGSQEPVPDIARQLRVKYILEGSVRRSPTALRITAQLIDAENDMHLWAHEFSGVPGQVLAFQDSVTGAIVSALDVRLLPEEKRAWEASSFGSAEAWELVAKATNCMTIDEVPNGIALVEQALRLTGDNAWAYCVLGLLYLQLANHAVGDLQSAEKAEEYLNRALAIDADQPVAHLGLATCLSFFQGDRVGAARHTARALALAPDDPYINAAAAGFYGVYMGQEKLADERLEHACEVSPLLARYWRAEYGYATRLYAGDFEEARVLCDACAELEPSDPCLLFVRPLTLAYLGDVPAALALLEQTRHVNPGSNYAKICRMLEFALKGEADSARASLTAELQASAARDGNYSADVACCLARAGATNEALDWLENAVNRGFINYPYLAEKSPFLEVLRGEPRFKKLMVRVKHEWEHFDE